ncbi:MAG: WecB/TagA/CpsF family glycosyltransferase [Propionibacteriaceae bacterium]|jgi:N-acetylglucosaminyldiphosphoundecaprenol N-acetyl-beta-D-mannosaminyltransferase|nr:WecB/TagA/CpsF family glycosyltransferase [Propionibacteriaceae bacterium]
MAISFRLDRRTGQLSLLGKDVFAGDMSALLDAFATRPGKTLVIPLNVDVVTQLQDSADFHRAYELADIVVLDGAPLVALARAMGAREINRLTGSDGLPAVAAAAPERHWRVGIVGGEDSAREAAVANLTAANPGLELRGFGLPMLASAADPASAPTVAELAAWKPRVVFVCLGAPKQEMWFATWQESLPDGVYMMAGASADFAAGKAKRAPVWLQRLGLEWVWRLAHEPRRLAGRYLRRGPRFVPFAIRSLARR